jgi:dynein heavy chain, axonemal
MKSVSTKFNVKNNCTTNRLNEFIKYNQGMERIQKSLDAYMDEKRVQFPRFYFLSNDELL